MSLCVRCANSALIRIPWENLVQPTVEESKMVHSWLIENSSPECALCQLVESEIRAVGEFEGEINTLMQFIDLFLKLTELQDKAPPTEDKSPTPRKDGPRRATEEVSAAGDDDECRHGSSDLETSQADPIVHHHALPDSSNDTMWALGLLPSDEDPNATVDQDSLERAMTSMKKIFTRHEGSQSCVVCDSMTDFYVTDGLDLDRLRHKLKEATTQSEKEAVIKHHSPPPHPHRAPGNWLRPSSIVRVEFVLESRGHWSAIRLQEYRRDEKAVRFRNRGPTLNTSLDASNAPGISHTVAEEPAGPSRPESPALAASEQRLVANTEIPLRKEYRQHAKDVCVLVPFQKGTHGFAREIGGKVDVEVIKLWLAQCGKGHTLCSQRIEESYPPGLILIDAELMCLITVAPDELVPYIALSYVWGYVSQPTLTKAFLDTWTCPGQLRSVEVPQTIRDTIRLVQMIGYRYIWVDALCIIQDDEASRHAQISRMHDIYRHADMTIVAADEDNCSNGLPGVTAVKDREYKHRRYELPGLCLMKAPASTKHGIETSSWRTRGWTFQEEICSRRTLVLLPEVMFFSCASAVWREDIQLEDEDSLPRSDEGLMSLASMLHQKSPGDSKDLLLLFRDLVKQYMQRTLSRTDDMENAFAGVAGILEPFVGPAYHGIPEQMFVEVIQGCWFWDTSLQRREGFPSWSWTGWVYRREQADVGIRPLSTGLDMSQLLTFYKVGRSGIELLGQSGIPEHQGDRFLQKMDAELRGHFIPNGEDDIRSRNESLEYQRDGSSDLIAFYTSIAYLKIRAPPGHFVGTSREYRVVHPQTNRQLTSIRLNVAHVAQNGSLLPFIVFHHDPDRRSFRLMLISMGGKTAERVNVTAQGRLVREEDWKSANPKRELIFMS